jgi:hypothetical protein
MPGDAGVRKQLDVWGHEMIGIAEAGCHCETIGKELSS